MGDYAVAQRRDLRNRNRHYAETSHGKEKGSRGVRQEQKEGSEKGRGMTEGRWAWGEKKKEKRGMP